MTSLYEMAEEDRRACASARRIEELFQARRGLVSPRRFLYSSRAEVKQLVPKQNLRPSDDSLGLWELVAFASFVYTRVHYAANGYVDVARLFRCTSISVFNLQPKYVCRHLPCLLSSTLR